MVSEFRSPKVAAETNAKALEYFTKNLKDPQAGREAFEQLLSELGNVVDSHPSWHPILTAPPNTSGHFPATFVSLEAYKGCDHTREFVRGFVTCPYGETTAEQLVKTVNAIRGLHAYRLDTPLYSDSAHPVVVCATEVELEADGTIRGRDAIAWFVQQEANVARKAQVAETWWSMRSSLLGSPHGSRSSLCVNQNTGSHMRKILEAMNDSGMFGPIREWSLEMLSQRKRESISETLISAAVTYWRENGFASEEAFKFELRGEKCKATVRDTWNDGTELSIRVSIEKGNNCDLHVSGFYDPKRKTISASDPKGSEALAKKFI